MTVGLILGFTVGLRLGLTVGFKLGLRVGLKVGFKVGLKVGLFVDFIVGANVGGAAVSNGLILTESFVTLLTFDTFSCCASGSFRSFTSLL